MEMFCDDVNLLDVNYSTTCETPSLRVRAYALNDHETCYASCQIGPSKRAVTANGVRNGNTKALS